MTDKSSNAASSIIPMDKLKGMIYTIRGMQVMLDSDLAEIYEVETKNFNRAVKRNVERFPTAFRFQLTQKEFDDLRCQVGTLNADESLRCQIGTLDAEPSSPLRSQNTTLDKENLKSQNATSSKRGRGQHRKYLPYVFTEQGVSMLSAVLRSDTAIKVSIQIINAFVEMRHFLQNNASIFARLDSVEKRQLAFEIKAEENFDRVFNALEAAEPPSKGIFYNGQVHDAHSFVSGLIRKAQKSIILIDNYVDDTVLTLLTKRKKNVSATIYTKKLTQQLALDLEKHNQQYPAITVETFADAHDRFLIIDEAVIYHIGASLKDLGKKWFAFSKFESGALEMLQKLGGAK